MNAILPQNREDNIVPASAPAPAPASASAPAINSQDGFILKFGKLIGVNVLHDAGLLPRGAYINRHKWHNHNRQYNVGVYVVIIKGCSFIVRGVRNGTTINDIVSKHEWTLHSGTFYEVNTNTWCMDLIHGPPHKIVEDIPEPEPMLSATALQEKENANKEEIELLTRRLRELQSVAKTIEIMKIAKKC